MGGKDQFGTSCGVFAGSAPARYEPPPSADMTDAMESYFYNLDVAATNYKAVMETLVRSNAKLTATNSELAHKIMGLTSKNKELQKNMNSLNKKLGNKPSTPSVKPPRVPKLGPSCNKFLYHKPDDCFHLDNNSNKCPAGFSL